MTEAGWTREKPTVAGWYWWRRDQHALPGVAIVCSDLSGYYMNRTGHNSTFDHVDDVIGEWLGPLTPTDRQQGRVEGLRDAEVIAQFMVMATPSNVAAALRFMADKLEAQAAQEGRKST